MKSFWILIFFIFIFSPFFVFSQTSTVTSTVNISVTAEIPGEIPPPLPPGGGGYIPETKVIFKGKAYPNAVLTILKNEVVAATFFASKSGLFEKELNGLLGGTYTFGIFAEDMESRQSVTLSFTVSIFSGMTTIISGIFIPPTIEVVPTQVERGQIVNILGQVFPESEVNIFISSSEIVKKTKASSKGEWICKLNTASLEEREHRVRAKALYGEGEQSPFSQTISFFILPPECRGADLNFDGKVDLVDFSILLYFWSQEKPTNRCADLNSDGIVNIVDFSIMMYWWTG